MNRDDIIRMAREAGLAHFYDSEGHCTGITDADLFTAEKDRNDARLVEILGPFAELVTAAEREACAKVCDDLPVPPYVSDNDAIIWDLTCVDCAEAIRERGVP
jgi:hypothetical protein